MTIRQALAWATDELRRHRCAGSDPAREAEALIEAAAGLDRSRLAAGPDAPLSERQRADIESSVRRRVGHEPLAYILGTAWFRGREFLVTPATLIPRPATEHVVDAALAAAGEAKDALFVDVGTGSGCIAVSLAAERPGSRVLATDASAAALAIARKNAARHGVAERVTFVRTDLLTASFRTGAAPVVVANLPYIPSASMRGLPPDILDHEPRTALDGGPDGLSYYRRLVMRLRAAKLPLGMSLIVELLPEQYGPLAALLKRRFAKVRCRRVANHQEVTVGLSAVLRP